MAKQRSEVIHKEAEEIKKQASVHSKVYLDMKREVEAMNKFKRNQVFYNEGKIREKLYNRQQ